MVVKVKDIIEKENSIHFLGDEENGKKTEIIIIKMESGKDYKMVVEIKEPEPEMEKEE